jgi:hypothetical protein
MDVNQLQTGSLSEKGKDDLKKAKQTRKGSEM